LNTAIVSTDATQLIADDTYNSVYQRSSGDGLLAHSRFFMENNCSYNRATPLGMTAILD